MNRGHIDKEAARQSDVAGDARALLAERFLGDLDNHVLPGLQHFGNELGTARRAGMAALIATVVPRTPWPAAFESRSARAPAAIGTPATAVWTATAATVASTAAEWPLEAGTRIAADAGRVTRKILTGSRRTANARRSSFA